jgi:DNA-binding beta-propeller fold protein YncE
MSNSLVYRPGAGNCRYWHGIRTGALSAVVLIVLVSVLYPGSFNGAALHTSEAIAAPTRSTTIALTPDETRLVVVNREANSLSIIKVKDENGNDVAEKLFEIGVGQEPRCVAVHPNGQVAYVTNGISGTVSVVDLVLGREVPQIVQGRAVPQIPVGTEPRGCALTPDGSLLYVANHTAGTVSIIVTSNPLAPILDGAVTVGRNPTAIAIKDGGTGNIADDTVFVTEIFAELNPDFVDPIPENKNEARDLGKQGVVYAFPAGNANPPITKIVLKPLTDSGFTANRVSPNNFCNTVPPAQSNIFCPNPADPTDPINTSNKQGVYPNQLLSAVIRGKLLYVTAIGPQPEPPEMFNVNVQALVYAVDTEALTEVAVDETFKNLNVQIAKEVAAPPPSLDKTFGNDIVAIDANLDPHDPYFAGDTFLIVSRGGNQVFRAKLADPVTGRLNILNAAEDRVDCRIQTGNLPSGVAMRQDGTLAYANNEANFSVTSMNINDGFCLTLQLDIPSSTPPAPGTVEHAVIAGKVAFFTALGVPDNGIFSTPIRDIIPRNFRGKQSQDAWSSCGSCHPDGLADGATWIFGTGPRQTKPLDGMFNKGTNMEDQGLLNWSAIRGSNNDFNANSRVTQGGCGFASVAFTGNKVTDPPDPCTNNNMLTPVNPAVYDHGITQGASDALDAQTLWIFAAVRALNQPQPSNLQTGRDVFATYCASCHGGPKWTKSEIFHRDNPAAVAQNGAPTDPNVTRLPAALPVTNLANEFFSFTCDNNTIKYLEDVGTFDATNPLEIRDNGAASIAFGVNGFNVPSLLSINYHAPYLHRGQAQTLEEVFPLHGLGPGRSGFPPTTTIQTQLTSTEQADLLVFLKSIDGTTAHFRSGGDDFRDLCGLCLANPADPRCGRVFEP